MNNNFNKVLIWTYGKVGSTSLINNFNTYSGAGETAKNILNNNSELFDQIQCYQFHPNFCGKYFLDNYDNLLIITVIRNPIDRNISAFWQNVDDMCPDWKNLSTNEIINNFNQNYNHNHTDQWIKEYFKTININFDTFIFDTKNKFNEIKDDNNNTILISRYEDIEFMINNVYDKYLNVSNKKENISKDKIYAEKYSDFKKQYKLPKELIKLYQNHDTTKKFYSEEEINLFISKYL